MSSSRQAATVAQISAPQPAFQTGPAAVGQRSRRDRAEDWRQTEPVRPRRSEWCETQQVVPIVPRDHPQLPHQRVRCIGQVVQVVSAAVQTEYVPEGAMLIDPDPQRVGDESGSGPDRAFDVPVAEERRREGEEEEIGLFPEQQRRA